MNIREFTNKKPFVYRENVIVGCSVADTENLGKVIMPGRSNDLSTGQANNTHLDSTYCSMKHVRDIYRHINTYTCIHLDSIGTGAQGGTKGTFRSSMFEQNY